MNQLTMMSFCLLATFGVLILQVNGNAIQNVPNTDACYQAKKRLSDCIQRAVDHDIRHHQMVTATICQIIPSTEETCEDLNDELKPCYSTLEMRLIGSADKLARFMFYHFCRHNEFSNMPNHVAANGLECMISKKEEIKNCINQYLLPRPPTNGLSGSDDPCAKYVGFEFCVKGHLSQCPSLEAFRYANLVFAFEKNNGECKNY
ncbi:hypothetical protein KR074_011610 [Drosophila pseudoananassae]|nr:hypothetical protein KR074_011610 [Drosophila pseudoananassae]